jgi:acetyltransferase
MGYCESLENGQEFLAAAREVAAKKPVLMLKAGGTPAGARAVSAHTGSASGSPAAYRAAFRQAGVIQVEEMAALFDLAQAFDSQPLPAGPGLGVVTNAGGPGILAADACAKSALGLPRPSAATLARLVESLPGFASLYNPVDVLGDAGPERYRAALFALADDPQIASVLTLLTPTAMAQPLETARVVADAAREGAARGKPFAACFLGGAAVREARRELLSAGVPCYDFPEAAVAALSAMYSQRLRESGPGPSACASPLSGAAACDAPWDDEAVAIVEAAYAKGLREIGGVLALEAAHGAGLPVLSTGLARTSAEAARLAGELGFPVRLRLAEREGVALLPRMADARSGRLGDADAVRRAFAELTARASRLSPETPLLGCLVQAVGAAPGGGFELTAGFTRDAQFGPLLFFGLAGVGAELLGEVSRRLAPLTPADAREMLREMRYYPLLRGACGGTAVSLAALERLLLGISRFALRAPRLAGAEFSPVLAGPQGVLIAGARLTLG